MSKRSIRPWTRVCLGVAVVLSLGSAAAAQPSRHGAADQPVAGELSRPGEPTNVTLNGEGGGTLGLKGFKGDVVNFRVDAAGRSDNPMGATGAFEVTHVRPDGTVLADFEGEVSCMMEGADVAVATGTITSGSLPAYPDVDIVGTQVGLTVADHGRRDHIGWSWLVMGFGDVSICASTAPFFPLTTGNFRVDVGRGAR